MLSKLELSCIMSNHDFSFEVYDKRYGYCYTRREEGEYKFYHFTLRELRKFVVKLQAGEDVTDYIHVGEILPPS